MPPTGQNDPPCLRPLSRKNTDTLRLQGGQQAPYHVSKSDAL